jgi:hypothetical protein
MITTIEHALTSLQISSDILFNIASSSFDVAAISAMRNAPEDLQKDPLYGLAVMMAQSATCNIIVHNLLLSLSNCNMITDADILMVSYDQYIINEKMMIDNANDLIAPLEISLQKSLFAKHDIDHVLTHDLERLPLLHNVVKNPEKQAETKFPPNRLSDFKVIGQLVHHVYDKYDDDALYFLEHDSVFQTLYQLYGAVRHGHNMNASSAALSTGIELAEDFFTHNAFDEASRYMNHRADPLSKSLAHRVVKLYKPKIDMPPSLINKPLDLN